MGIADKATYGEYYWAMQVEAAQFLDESIEDVLASDARSLIYGLGIYDKLPAALRPVIDKMREPTSAGYGMVLGRFVSEAADSILGNTLGHALKDFNYWMAESFRDVRIDFSTATTLYQRKAITHGLYEARMASEGYKDAEGAAFYLAQMPYPSIPDLVLYSRYHGDPDNPWSEVQEWFDIPPRDWPVWRWLGLQRLTTMQLQTLFRRGLISAGSLSTQLAQIGWSPIDRPLVQELGWSIPNAMLLVQGDLQQMQSRDRVLQDISIADINPKYAQQYLDAILTKPASTDIVAYGLRQDFKLPNLDRDLQRIGIHPEYTHLYKELAYQIPPIADIITMAVREAFTPEIAARFGQYQDYPKDLEMWAEKKGLSKEWSERYWAAHWSLPSATQGFEMLHRGIIGPSDLDMLLRALDVMPFWREKLTGIAYRRLTRVDIRRMYKTGVLTKDEVYESYIEHGYTEKNARRMTEFTVQWAMPKEASITRSDILTAYKSRMIDRTEASGLLEDMGEEYFHREFMLTAVDYKKGLELTENRIKGIRNLYKRRVYDINKTRDELLKLDLPADEVDNLMEQWYYEVRAEAPRLWTTAQTLSFIKDGLITRERGIAELTIIGFDTEHIDVYIRSIE